MIEQPTGIYLHIPFCRRKCTYCDFNSYVMDEAMRDAYVAALVTEIGWWGRILAGSCGESGTTGAARSVYVGGGTPSLLTPDQLDVLLRGCVTDLGVAPEAEITIEANPESAELAWLERVRRLGYNRLSLGVQSFDDRLLAPLGRLHSASDAMRCYHDARQAGFENISIDLMFGMDSQPLEIWRQSLETAVLLGPEHVSLYGLTVEEGTALAGKVRRGTYVPALPESAAEMYGLAEELLGTAGYEHYELSNWAKPGRRSRHNLNYWMSGPYLGCGAGAHARLGAYRFWTVREPRTYIAAWRQHAEKLPGTFSSNVSPNPLGLPEGVLENWEELSPRTRIEESIMLGLRLAEGLSLASFQQQAGQSLDRLAGDTLAELCAAGLLATDEGRLRTTARGRLLLDEVLVRLFAAVEESN